VSVGGLLPRERDGSPERGSLRKRKKGRIEAIDDRKRKKNNQGGLTVVEGKYEWILFPTQGRERKKVPSLRERPKIPKKRRVSKEKGKKNRILPLGRKIVGDKSAGLDGRDSSEKERRPGEEGNY